MSKTYPLDVDEVHECDGGGFMGYQSKGHHERQAFADEVESLFDAVIDPEDVNHRWYRTAFNVTLGEGLVQLEAKGPGRGVYPVTEWMEWS